MVAGAFGMKLVLARIFLLLTSLVAMLAGAGLASLSARPRTALAAVILTLFLALDVAIGSAPAPPAIAVSPRRWMDHQHGDWKSVGRALSGDRSVPVVTVQHFITDGVMHYASDRVVARLRVEGDGLVVGQLQRQPDVATTLQVGARWSPPPGSAFVWIDPTGTWESLVRARNAVAPRVLLHAECSLVRAFSDDARVYRCVAR